MDLTLGAADLALLRDFLSVARGHAMRCLLIGAGARVVSIEKRFGISGARATLDWDFAVRVASWDEFARLRRSLTEVPGAPFRSGAAAHRLVHERGRLLDVIPFGGLENPSGQISWPDRRLMSVRGLVEADPLAESIEVAPDLNVDVASIPSWALLKLDAYRDRRGRGETKDIQDFAWLLGNYERTCNPLRPFEELAEPIRNDQIDADDAGAMLLGKDVATLHAWPTIEPIVAVLAESGDRYSRLVGDVLAGIALGDEGRKEEIRGRIRARMVAFLHGIDAGPHRLGR